jgi:hypothetical protein
MPSRSASHHNLVAVALRMSHEPAIGISLSPRRAAELEIDAHELFLAVLIHLKPRWLRLPLLWDEISPEPGRYELGSIQWYLDRAEQAHCRVLLTAGIKEPDGPSYSVPSWLRGDSEEAAATPPGARGRLTANLLLMLERVVAALADYDAIDAWQVENDPFLPAFRRRAGLSIDPALLQREVEVVREVDARHRPILVSHSGGSVFDARWRMALAIADIIGENLDLPAEDDERRRLPRALSRGTSAGRLRLQALAAARQGKPLWISSLQTNLAPHHLQSSARSLAAMEAQVDLARRSGARRIYLQGAESWFIGQRGGDRRPWELARRMLAAGGPA